MKIRGQAVYDPEIRIQRLSEIDFILNAFDEDDPGASCAEAIQARMKELMP